MKTKKVLGIAGIVACVLLLMLVSAGIITWKLFWGGILLLAAFAYLVLPRMKYSN